MRDDEHEQGPDTAQSEEADELSEKVPDEVSGEGATPWGSSDEHSDTPGPHGTGEVYPRGDRPEGEDDSQD